MGLFVTITTVAFFAHWTCNLISMQWCSCMGRNAWVCRLLASWHGRTCFSLYFSL